MDSQVKKAIQISEEKITEWYMLLRKKYHESKKSPSNHDHATYRLLKGERNGLEGELGRLKEYFPDFDFLGLPPFYDDSKG